MKFSASLLLLFLISVALVIASLIGFLNPLAWQADTINWMSAHSYSLMAAGYFVLAIGVLLKAR